MVLYTILPNITYLNLKKNEGPQYKRQEPFPFVQLPNKVLIC